MLDMDMMTSWQRGATQAVRSARWIEIPQDDRDELPTPREPRARALAPHSSLPATYEMPGLGWRYG